MRRFSALALLLPLFCLSRLTAAQSAAITGTVTDTTAAVVPDVKVTARNVATNLARSSATDESPMRQGKSHPKIRTPATRLESRPEAPCARCFGASSLPSTKAS